MPIDLPGDFLFLDESGDLGLGEKSTPVFVAGILHLTSSSALSRTIKRARKASLGRNAPKSELKWSNCRDEVRRAVIEQICREKEHIAGISAAVIEKGWISTIHASRAADVRYNFAVRLAMEQGQLLNPSVRKRVRLTIDARNRRATETLTEYVELLTATDEICCSVKVIAEDSERIPQLQAADFAVGAIYHAYAHGEWRFLNRIRGDGIAVKIRTLRAKKKPAP